MSKLNIRIYQVSNGYVIAPNRPVATMTNDFDEYVAVDLMELTRIIRYLAREAGIPNQPYAVPEEDPKKC